MGVLEYLESLTVPSVLSIASHKLKKNYLGVLFYFIWVSFFIFKRIEGLYVLCHYLQPALTFSESKYSS